MREFVPYPFESEQFPACLPGLRMSRIEARRHPVVIVGAGPVGLSAALGLANHGVPSVVLEADPSVCFGSRAICISRRSLEIIERLGALDGFLKTGLAWTGGRSYYRDAQVLNFTMPQDQNQKLPPMVNLAQYHIEQILLERARQRADLIDIRWQSRATALRAHDAGIQLNVATPLGDYALDADWLIGADGGRSFVREALGLELQGTRYEGRYVIVDIQLDSERPTERLAYFDPPCNPGSTVLVHKQPDRVWRIDYQLRDGEDPVQAVQPENVIPRVESLLAMMGERGAWAPIWITIYKANALSPRPRAVRRRRRAPAADLRRARRELGHRRRRQPGVETRPQDQRPGLGRIA
jgi:3-(3-hydroxy-phenyl)propionate hydroxylase